MISDEVARNGLAALSAAAVMLMEDVGEGLTIVQTDITRGDDLAAALVALGADLSALGAAVAVLARRRCEPAS